MDKSNIIIIRYGELHLKGKNRGFFEKKLIENIKFAIKDYQCNLVVNRGRYEVLGYNPMHEKAICNSLSRVFGIHSFSVALLCDGDIDNISSLAITCLADSKSFKVDTHRADKSYPMSSYEVSSAVGHQVLQACPDSKVDVVNPDCIIKIDIRTRERVYVYQDICAGLGGMPYDTAGSGMLMLSGGIDSPVAGFMTAKRGLKLIAVHFW